AFGNPDIDYSLSMGVIRDGDRGANTISDGTYKYLQKSIDPNLKFINHNCKLSAGFPGGPLVNDSGQVVGINWRGSLKFSDHFATPSHKVKAMGQKINSVTDLQQLVNSYESGDVLKQWKRQSVANIGFKPEILSFRKALMMGPNDNQKPPFDNFDDTNQLPLYTGNNHIVDQIVVRDVSPDTLRPLKTLIETVFPFKYSDQFYNNMLNDREWTKLAYHNDQLIGEISCRIEVMASGRRRLYIQSFGCLAAYRRQGIGSRLFAQIMSQAESDSSLTSVYLHVRTDNTVAIKLYEKFGFKFVKTIPHFYYDDFHFPPTDAFVYEKPLKH
ncbi:unnamed protein product, partial [Medioppia subpectinata]